MDKLISFIDVGLVTFLIATSPVVSSYDRTLSSTSISSIGLNPSSVVTSVPATKQYEV